MNNNLVAKNKGVLERTLRSALLMTAALIFLVSVEDNRAHAQTLYAMDWQVPLSAAPLHSTLYEIDMATGAAINPVLLQDPIDTVMGIERAHNGSGLWVVSSGQETLYLIDPVTGATLYSVPTSRKLYEGDLAMDPVSGTLYVCGSALSDDRLLTIDTATGVVSGIGIPGAPTSDMSACAFGPDGILYAIDPTKVVQANSTRLHAIDPATATILSTQTLSVDLGGAGGMDFHPYSGVPYFLDGSTSANGTLGTDSFYSLDTIAATATLIGPYTAANSMASLAFFAADVRDNCGGSIPVTAPSSVEFNNNFASTDGAPSLGCGVAGDDQLHNDIWYKYTATETGALTLSTCNDADFDTRLAFYSGSDCPAINADLLGCSDDTPGCTFGTSLLTVPVLAGNDYLIRVGGAAGVQGEGVLNLDFVAAPVCPTCGNTEGAGWTLTSTLVGGPNGTDWSWYIESPVFDFVGVPVVHVPGMTAGNLADDLDGDGLVDEYDIALRFADSINSYSAANSCDTTAGSYELRAEAKRLFGQVSFSIASQCEFNFYVSSPTDPTNPNCEVDPLGAFCQFNPTIEAEPLPGVDCNLNGWDDFIDVADGSSLDSNDNGIPDECEGSCPWDVTGNVDMVALKFYGDEVVTFDPSTAQWWLDDVWAAYYTYQNPAYLIYFPLADLNGDGTVSIEEVMDIYNHVGGC